MFFNFHNCDFTAPLREQPYFVEFAQGIHSSWKISLFEFGLKTIGFSPAAAGKMEFNFWA